MNSRKSTFIKRLTTTALPLLLPSVTVAALAMPLITGTAQARPAAVPRSAPISGFQPPQPWRWERPLLLLPLQFGTGFNLDQQQFAVAAPYAEEVIRERLGETGKLSVFRVNSHSPLLMRGMLDEKITQEQINTLVKSPTLENANTVLSSLQFDETPFVAVFSLGKVTTYSVPPRKQEAQPPVVQIELTGTFYELNSTTPVKTITVTSDLKPRNQLNFWPNDRVLLAIDNAAAQIAAQFVAPLPQVELPAPEGPAFLEKVNAKGAKPVTWIEPVKPPAAQ